jgi:hypothetical protein
MNDSGLVKSPENPGFKPKNTPGDEVHLLLRGPMQKESPLRRKPARTDENRRKLRTLHLTAAAAGASVLRLSG